MTRRIFSAVLVLTCSGCASHTPVAVVNTPDDLLESRQVVLRCTVASAPRPDWAGRDPKPQPSRVAGGSVADAVLYVDSIVKGKFDGSTLRIKDARTSGDSDPDAVPLDKSDIRDGQHLMVGFDRGPFGVPVNFAVAHEKQK